MNTLTLSAQPSLNQLNNLIRRVPAYPISVSSLLEIAKLSKQPKEVVDFYQSFNHDQIFEDSDELQSRSEQVEIMRQAGKETPREWEVAPEDY
jgi:hypothetical protein